MAIGAMAVAAVAVLRKRKRRRLIADKGDDIGNLKVLAIAAGAVKTGCARQGLAIYQYDNYNQNMTSCYFGYIEYDHSIRKKSTANRHSIQKGLWRIQNGPGPKAGRAGRLIYKLSHDLGFSDIYPIDGLKLLHVQMILLIENWSHFGLYWIAIVGAASLARAYMC